MAEGLLQTLEKFQVNWTFLKKSRFAGPEIFLRFETDLDFLRPCISEIKVQIKRASDELILSHLPQKHLKLFQNELVHMVQLN